MRPPLILAGIIAFCGGLVAVLPGASVAVGRNASTAESGRDGLMELPNLEQLRTLFKRDAGKPRIVLLLSPT